MNFRGNWHLLDSLQGKGREVFAISKIFEETVESLIEMIGLFHIDHVCGEEYDLYKTDYRLLNFYSFEGYMVETPPLPGLE